MIKFEEHDGKLFRMLEKPVPLTDDTELPVLVRMIQDDTMLGKANKRSCHPDTLAQKIICSNLTDDGLFLDGNYAYRYEIIGYPVAEGSAEWALYQMMCGKKVCNPALATEKATRLGCDDVEQFNTFWHIVGDAVAEGKGNYGTLSVSSWNAAASSTGWQIYYELKLTFKVGDWVKYDIDSYLQVIEPSGKERTLCRTLSGVIVYPYTSLLTKASPSEVVVHIGCLSGTVRRINDIFFCLNPSTEKGWVVPEATIPLAMLDTTTAELVRELLKAQEKGE